MVGNAVLKSYTMNNAIINDSGHKEPVKWETVFMQKSTWIFGKNWSEEAGITSTNLFGKNFSPHFSEIQSVCWSFSLVFDSHTFPALFYISKGLTPCKLHCLGSLPRPMGDTDGRLEGWRKGEARVSLSSLCFRGHFKNVYFSSMISTDVISGLC